MRQESHFTLRPVANWLSKHHMIQDNSPIVLVPLLKTQLIINIRIYFWNLSFISFILCQHHIFKIIMCFIFIYYTNIFRRLYIQFYNSFYKQILIYSIFFELFFLKINWKNNTADIKDWCVLIFS